MMRLGLVALIATLCIFMALLFMPGCVTTVGPDGTKTTALDTNAVMLLWLRADETVKDLREQERRADAEEAARIAERRQAAAERAERLWMIIKDMQDSKRAAVPTDLIDGVKADAEAADEEDAA